MFVRIVDQKAFEPLLFPCIFSLLIGYCAGSFPTAYLLLKQKSNVDIRVAGSGNVGAMNAYEVTSSKLLGFAVFAIDALKGCLAVLFAMALFGNDFTVLATSGLAAIIGHDYPVWLKFKGGIGLSTTAGVMLVLGWAFVFVWCLIWTVSYLTSKHIHGSNIIASILSPVVIVSLPATVIAGTLPPFTGTTEVRVLVIIVCCLILLRHIRPVNQMLGKSL